MEILKKWPPYTKRFSRLFSGRSRDRSTGHLERHVVSLSWNGEVKRLSNLNLRLQQKRWIGRFCNLVDAWSEQEPAPIGGVV